MNFNDTMTQLRLAFCRDYDALDWTNVQQIIEFNDKWSNSTKMEHMCSLTIVLDRNVAKPDQTIEFVHGIYYKIYKKYSSLNLLY